MTAIVTDIDPLAVLEALGIAPASVPAPVSGGWDTALFRFQAADGRWRALRVYRSPEQAFAARREEIALRAAADAGIPAPQLETAGLWRDLPALVLSWVEGVTLLDALRQRPWRVLRLAAAFGRTQAAIHAVPAPADLCDPEGVRDKLRSLDPALADRVLSAGLRFDRLAHLDYHPLNVMTDGERITGVLDWTNAAGADPRLDVARTATLVGTAAPPPGPLRTLAGPLRALFLRAWMRAYVGVAGPLGDLAPFMALAGLSRLEDLEWARGRPGVWEGGLDAAPVRQWVARWRRRAGLS
ncbi:MAG TPA: aminoglycoside phosphotransferase family protein [Dehalococcoidia bacterium]|nr:aminoglycoside phosphotransferase family protein [Dehalococcoidia bacterium]